MRRKTGGLHLRWLVKIASVENYRQFHSPPHLIEIGVLGLLPCRQGLDARVRDKPIGEEACLPAAQPL